MKPHMLIALKKHYFIIAANLHNTNIIWWCCLLKKHDMCGFCKNITITQTSQQGYSNTPNPNMKPSCYYSWKLLILVHSCCYNLKSIILVQTSFECKSMWESLSPIVARPNKHIEFKGPNQLFGFMVHLYMMSSYRMKKIYWSSSWDWIFISTLEELI